MATEFIDLFEPDYYMPFAGEYVLAGSLSSLNEYTANPPRAAAKEWFEANVDSDAHQCVFLNSGEHIDLSAGTLSQPYEPIDPAEKQRYIDEVLSKREFSYEDDPLPDPDALYDRIPEAYEGLEENRQKVAYETDTTVLVSLLDDEYVELSLDGEGYDIVSDPNLDQYEGYVRVEVDPRLLRRLLDGTESAHWSDAKIGSHLGISKEPDIYERQLYNCLGSFHA